ncbi:MAG: hypothetical protein AAFY69_12500, partial [Pseudomonadota bacterium]
MPKRQRRIVIALAAATAAVLGTTHMNHDAVAPETERYIVSADSVAAAAHLVAEVDGLMIGELGIINAVDADLTAKQVAALQALPSVSLFADAPVETSGKKKEKKRKSTASDDDASSSGSGSGSETQQVATSSDALAGSTTTSDEMMSGWQDLSALIYAFLTDLSATPDAGSEESLFGGNENVSADAGAYTAYADQVGARELHAAGITGMGVTIAVVDSGIWDSWMYNGIDMRLRAAVDTTGAEAIVKSSVGDDSGHGSHVTSVAASNRWA